jgi:nicotinamide-nucleotide amidase
MNSKLLNSAVALRDILAQQHHRIVLAESCTGGWVAASLACIPGISQWWCGSHVVYRCDSKHRWLGIDNKILDDPSMGPVSELVTQQLAERSLERTSEADIALAVTGDLGPGVPPDKDGIIYCAVSMRDRMVTQLRKTKLTLLPPEDSSDFQRRIARLEYTANWVLLQAVDILKH